MKEIMKDKEGNILQIREYDRDGREIHYQNSFGTEFWNDYDENGRLIHIKQSFVN